VGDLQLVHEVLMPKQGLTMEEGTIVRWTKNEGEPVAEGEILLVIESDKATFEIEAERSGVVTKIVCPAGSTVKVTDVIAYIEEA
jgi:pyruvate/2-oxoglutarate dehydrogenase complex dihydrolipoamide acyltransferase (E2) component